MKTNALTFKSPIDGAKCAASLFLSDTTRSVKASQIRFQYDW